MRGSARPRYLIRSALVNVLFSRCASETAVWAARRASSGLSPRPGPAAVRCSPQTDGATEASETLSRDASRSAHPACSSPEPAGVASLRARVAKFDACASCASSRWDGARPYLDANAHARAGRR